jgi:hypothetical protein
VPVLVCLRTRVVRFVKFVPKVFMKIDGDFVNIILLYLRFGATYRSLDCFSFEDGTDRFSRNVGNSNTNLRCVTSQKSEDLV